MFNSGVQLPLQVGNNTNNWNQNEIISSFNSVDLLRIKKKEGEEYERKKFSSLPNFTEKFRSHVWRNNNRERTIKVKESDERIDKH